MIKETIHLYETGNFTWTTGTSKNSKLCAKMVGQTSHHKNGQSSSWLNDAGEDPSSMMNLIRNEPSI